MRGSITPALITITTAFLIVIYGLLFVLSNQFDYSHRQLSQEKALYIAEAGVNYYRWHLAHDPTDYTDGTGESGPYEKEYTDPQGEAIGKYSLEIFPPSVGSSVVTIISTGWTYNYPKIKREITVQYGRPSFAEYAFLSNASSWYGSNITVSGPVHSNNGIRQDGTNLSLVNSTQETYICGNETGCYNQSYCNTPCNWNSSQARCICPGVWGGGSDSGLWQFPGTPINFESVSVNFDSMKNAAETDGLYLPESALAQGYHIVLNNQTLNLYRVNTTNYYYGYTPDDDCQRRYERISSETLIGTYDVDDIPILFSEEHLWVEGTIDGRMTIVAARFPIDTNAMNIWIRGNIRYSAYDRTDILGLIAQNDIYFVRNLPENFYIDAVLMAQQGKIIRHRYYPSSCGYSSTHSVKDSLTIYGGIISYNKSYWNYGSPPVSGFTTRNVSYDPNVFYNPPPFFPTTGEYDFISWVED